MLLAAPTPSPSPSFNADVVTPGVVGFLAMAVIAAMTVLLIVDMNRRIRRTRYRAEAEARIAEAERQRDER
jgi:hypothetical protein